MRALVDFCEGLTLTGGDCDGELMTVLPWEKRFIHGAFKVPGSAAISVARGCGKSALVAAIASAVVDPTGPLHGRRREVVVCASAFLQGKVIFEDVLSFLRFRHDIENQRLWRKNDSANNASLEHRPSGARIRCIGSDPARSHGLRPSLVAADEPAQWPGTTSERMLAALRTSLGKVPNSKLIALGTRPAGGNAHWFNRMLNGEAAYSQLHAAHPDDPPFRVRTWRKANPSLSILPSLEKQIRIEAAEAKRSDVALASFKSLRLNLGIEDTVQAMLLDADTWERAEGDAEQRGPSIWGIDAGTSAAQSAVSSYWPVSGALDAFAVFPELPSLVQRGLADGVGRLYVDCARRGELKTLGERVSDLGGMLREAERRWGRPRAVVCDRWRVDELRQCMGEVNLRVPILPRGMGFQDGAADVREFRRAVIGGRVTPRRSLLLRSAMREARTVSDPAGNAKLAKGAQGGRRARARDDSAAAAILAVAEGSRRASRLPKAGGHRVTVVRG